MPALLAVRARRIAAAFGALTLTLATPAVAAPAEAGASGASDATAAAEEFGSTTLSYIVPTRHGDLYLEVVHPTLGGEVVRGPVILTLTPYSVLGRNGDADSFVPRGYVRATADVVGTGNSGGCFDYGGIRERQSGYDLVEWIAAQPWSTGKVAMMGGSYEGTTATATAVERPPHLTTIVPIAGISRWYGYAFSGGIRYLWTNEALGNQGPGSAADEGFDTPLAFDFGLAIPPPLDPQDANWAERVETSVVPCDELIHTEHGYDQTPDYDSFWVERDYLAKAGTIRIPVLVAHNWGDYNVKQEEGFHLWQALTRSSKRVLYVGTRWEGHGAPPGAGWSATLKAWLDRYMLGVKNGTDKLPSVISQTSTSAGPGAYSNGEPATKNLTLYARNGPASTDGYAWRLLPTAPSGGGAVASFPGLGTTMESQLNTTPRQNASWLWFESPALTRDLRVFGEIKLQAWLQTEREWVTLTPTVVDIDPARYGPGRVALNPDSIPSTTRGWLDSRYRNGLVTQQLVQSGAPFGMTVVLKPLDYTFLKGHSIGLAVQTEIAEWNVPKPYPCGTPGCPTIRLLWESGQTRLILPVVGSTGGLFLG